MSTSRLAATAKTFADHARDLRIAEETRAQEPVTSWIPKPIVTLFNKITGNSNRPAQGAVDEAPASLRAKVPQQNVATATETIDDAPAPARFGKRNVRPRKATVVRPGDDSRSHEVSFITDASNTFKKTSRSTLTCAFGFGEGSNSNIAKGLGYIPLLGTIIGIARIVTAVQDLGTRYEKAPTIARGLIESLSIGIVLLPVDLIATAIRSVTSSRRQVTL